MNIETDRLLLRKLTSDDANAIFENWASDPEVTRYLTWNPHKNIEVTKNILDIWIDEYKDPFIFRFGIELKENRQLIGMIDIVEKRTGNLVIGYCLGKKFWNHGYMTEALVAYCDFLFLKGYTQLLIEACVENVGSNKVIKKASFELIDTFERPLSSIKQELVKVNVYKFSKE